MSAPNTLIVGASAAGLATAACLKEAGISYIILDKEPNTAHKWRGHYDRLHLHTSKSWSSLPFLPFAKHIDKFPSRKDVIDYLENYIDRLDLQPQFNTEVTSIKKHNDGWLTITSKGNNFSKNVVIATGMNHTACMPAIRGLDSFRGTILHSSQYHNGQPFKGKKVLVVGFGNSACEQAICLHEHGAFPSLSVRSPVNVLPRDIFGIPVLQIGKLTSIFPNRIADKITAPVVKLMIGDITKHGLRKSKYGPREQIEKQQRIPLLDIGTIDLIRKGHISVFENIQSVDGNTVYFEDGRKQDFDAIILATGYKHDLERIIQLDEERLNDLKNRVDKQKYFGKDGLYFCGFYVSPRGMLKEIGEEAKLIAKLLKR